MQSDPVKAGQAIFQGTPLAGVSRMPIKAETDSSLPLDVFQKSAESARPGTASVKSEKTTITLSPGQTIDMCIEFLTDAMRESSSARLDVQRADRNVRDAESHLSSADFSIMRVEMDNENTDVSHEGFSLNSHFWNVKNETNDGRGDFGSASGRMDTARSRINVSYERVAALEKELGANPEQYGAVLGHLAKAKSLILDAGSSASGAGRKSDDGGRELGDAEGDMTWVSSAISEIQFDGPGKDVSHAGRELRRISDRVEWNLRDADHAGDKADADMRSMESKASSAIDALKKARAALG